MPVALFPLVLLYGINWITCKIALCSPYFSCESTSLAFPTILSSNLEVRPEATLDERNKDKWR